MDTFKEVQVQLGKTADTSTITNNLKGVGANVVFEDIDGKGTIVAHVLYNQSIEAAVTPKLPTGSKLQVPVDPTNNPKY